MDKLKCMGHKGKLLFWFASFWSESKFSLRFLRLVFKIFLFFFYLRIFNDKNP